MHLGQTRQTGSDSSKYNWSAHAAPLRYGVDIVTFLMMVFGVDMLAIQLMNGHEFVAPLISN